MKYSIRLKLICMMCLLIVIAVGGGTLLLISPIIAADYEQRIQSSNAAMAESLSRNIQHFIKTEEVIAGTTAEYPGLLVMSKSQRREVLARTVATNPSIQRISITDLSGNQIARSEGLETNRRQAAWYKDFMEQRRPGISSVYYSPSDQEMPVISIIYGIHVGEELVGLLQAVVNMEALQRLVETYDAGAGSYAFLLGADGALLAHPDTEKVRQLYNYTSFTRQVLHRQEDGTLLRDSAGEVIEDREPFEISPSQQLLVQRAFSGDNGSGEYEDLDGERYLCVYRSVALLGRSEPWHLFVVQKRSTAMAFMNEVMVTSVTMAVVVVLLACLLIIAFSRRITHPIEVLSIAAEKIKNGDLSVEVPIRGQAELRTLADAFNNMVRGLRTMKADQLHTEGRIRALAYHDPLTGLPNRASLHKFLEDTLQKSNGWLSGAILFIDLDDFKSINDRFGHAVGDEVLITAGRRIRQVAGGQSFVCRLGGDEFVVACLTNDPVDQGIQLAGQILAALQQKCNINGVDIALSGSIGIAAMEKCCICVEDLLHEADGAMYAAKHAGRNCWKLYHREEEQP